MRLKELFSQKEINRLALPAILAGIAEPVISLVDTAFIGQIGTVELAAVGIAGSFYTMMVWILSQTLTAISAIVSKKYGEGNLSQVLSLVPQAIISNLILGVLILLLTSSFAAEIFSFYNAKGQVLQACVDYFSIRSLGFPFSLGTLLIFGVFRGIQNTLWAMIIASSGALANIFLDYFLIFGIEGLVPKMGLKGAALASLIAQILMFVMALLTLLIKSPFQLRFSLKLNPYFKDLMGMSLDLFIRTILLNFTFYLATRYATWYGKAVVAAHTIALNIWLFSSFFIDGFGHAGNALAGKFFGQKDNSALFRLGKDIGSISAIIGFGLAIVYALSSPFLIDLFTKDAEVISQFNSVFWLVIISQPINAIAFALDGIYKGLGETKILRNLLIISTLLVFVPIIVSLHYILPGLLGIWIAFLFWMCTRSSYLTIDFRNRFNPEKSTKFQ